MLGLTGERPQKPRKKGWEFHFQRTSAHTRRCQLFFDIEKLRNDDVCFFNAIQIIVAGPSRCVREMNGLVRHRAHEVTVDLRHGESLTIPKKRDLSAR